MKINVDVNITRMMIDRGKLIELGWFSYRNFVLPAASQPRVI